MSNKRAVGQYNEIGRLIKTFPSITEAAREIGDSPGNICNAILFDHKVKGYYWDYEDEREQNRPIEALKNNKVVLYYKAINHAKKDGFAGGGIGNCLNGKQKTYKGYSWRYAVE